MNNLHRELAPISDAAWAQIEEEACRTFKRRIAGRRVVDMPEPAGDAYAALTTGHIKPAKSNTEGVQMHSRVVIPVVELRAPFTVNRSDIDDVDRGAGDSDWDPVKAAAEQIALSEDRLVFYGDELGIHGIVPESSNAKVALPQDLTEVPAAVASAINEMRMAGVEGTYSLLLSAKLYTELSESTDHGYPIRKHVERLVGEGNVIWAPALEGALLIANRGGDYELHLGQDLSIGYLSHDADTVQLYLQESLAFRVNTTEASVVIAD